MRMAHVIFFSLSPFKCQPPLTHNGRLNIVFFSLWIGCFVFACTDTRPWHRHTQRFIFLWSYVTSTTLARYYLYRMNEYSPHCKPFISKFNEFSIFRVCVCMFFVFRRDRFPFYKSNDDRWKNSVRHNLSINPHFRKGNKAPQGAGHLWIISTRDSEANILAWEHVSYSSRAIRWSLLNDSRLFCFAQKKQRLELFFKMEKTFAQGVEANADVSPTAITQDETSMAVANLTSMLDSSQSTSPPSTGAHETVRRNKSIHLKTPKFNCWIFPFDRSKMRINIKSEVTREIQTRS